MQRRIYLRYCHNSYYNNSRSTFSLLLPCKALMKDLLSAALRLLRLKLSSVSVVLLCKASMRVFIPSELILLALKSSFFKAVSPFNSSARPFTPSVPRTPIPQKFKLSSVKVVLPFSASARSFIPADSILAHDKLSLTKVVLPFNAAARSFIPADWIPNVYIHGFYQLHNRSAKSISATLRKFTRSTLA